MTDIATGLHMAADYLAGARFVPTEADEAREYAAPAMAELPPDLAALVDEALSAGDWNVLDQIARAFEPPAVPMPQPKPRRQRKPRQPTLASVAKQASKAALEVARYEIKPDGTVVVVTGAPESSTEASNPWLDDLKVTKQ